MKLDKDVRVGDRVKVKPKEDLPNCEVIGVFNYPEGHPISRGIGFITSIENTKYERHYRVHYPFGEDFGLEIIVTDGQLEKAFDIRNCTLFKALNMCGDCETRFYCYTNKWGKK